MNYATTLNMDQQGRIIIPAKVRKMLCGTGTQLEAAGQICY